MNTTNDSQPARHSLRQATVWALVLSSMISTPVLSAQTDISSIPITTTSAAQVKPNIMLLMDTSDSMKWSHMPDEVELQVTTGAKGYKSAECNLLYYNRNARYDIPKGADGLPLATPVFNAAVYDAFDVTSVHPPVDLRSQFQAFESVTLRFVSGSDTPRAAYYYYKTGGTPITGYASPACGDYDDDNADPNATGGGTWNRVIVGSNTGVGGTDERVKFATWYTYYRTRILLIKTAASLAFTPLTDSFRVGLITVQPTRGSAVPNTVNPAKYLAIDDFNTVQRGAWFDKLFAQKPGGSSPTREGLARVGRHYAGMHDGINEGMTGDPVQYSCQQNFTIMTTDGYWNAEAESTGLAGGFLGGPVDITGKTLVGQRDGNLDSLSTNGSLTPPTVNVNVTPRPIWDGFSDGLRNRHSKNNSYAYVPCGSYFRMSTRQDNATTNQTLTRTVQTTRSTLQNLMATAQNLRASSQLQRNTSQTTESTFQSLQGTRQNRESSTQRLASTAQTTESTVQYIQTTSSNRRSTYQRLQGSSAYTQTQRKLYKSVFIPRQSTTQMLRSTSQTIANTSQQNLQTVSITRDTAQQRRRIVQTNSDTSQTTQRTAQNLQHTEQIQRSTTQILQSTLQATATSSTLSLSTSQLVMSTSQLQQSTLQLRRRTVQTFTCDHTAGEVCTPSQAGTCVEAGLITCTTVLAPTVGSTPVAACTASAPALANDWKETFCDPVTTAPVGVASCTNTAAGPGNSYVRTICNTATTPTVGVASCSATPPAAGNSYTETFCNIIPTGPTLVASCAFQPANSGNMYTQTSCTNSVPVTTGVSSCTAQSPNGGNGFTTIVCGRNDTPDTGVASCAASGPTSGNGYTTTSCTPNNTTSVPVASCTNSGPTAANFYTTTSCFTDVTADVGVPSCSGIPAGSGNSYTATLCSTAGGTVASGTCVADSPTSGNGFTTTTCPILLTGPTPVDAATCLAGPGNSGNSWTTTNCPVSDTGLLPVASCSASGPSTPLWQTVTCSPNNGSTPVASCVSDPATAVNSWTATTCPTAYGPMTPIASCTPDAAGPGNGFVSTTCPVIPGSSPVATCTDDPTRTLANNYTTTVCAPNNTSNTPVASCTSSGPTVGNGYTTTTCTPNDTNNIAVASCTASGPTAVNGYTTTTCPAETLVSGPVLDNTCMAEAASGANSFQRTECAVVITSTATDPGTCVVDLANGIDCVTIVTPTAPVASCTAQTANAGNGWIEITCADNNVLDEAVAACAASGPTAANSWTTTVCPAAVTTGPAFVASCNPTAATSGNGWTTTSCPSPNRTGPTGVSACTDVPASSGNSFVATVCGTNNALPTGVASCTDEVASAGNSWTATTCSDNNVADHAVAVCVAQTAALVNGWRTVVCPPPMVTTNVAVPSCTDDPTATAGNSYTVTACSQNNVLNTPSGTCSPIAASAGNSYTLTTCPILTTGPTGVATCGNAAGNGGNSWTTTSCTPFSTPPTPVASCLDETPTAGNAYLTVTCSTNNTPATPVASCSGGGPTSMNGYTTTTCSSNNNLNDPVAGCTPISPTSGNGYTTTTCPILDSGAIGTATCTASGSTPGNLYTTTTCPGVGPVGPTPVASCTNAPTPTAANSYTTTSCSTVTSGPSFVSTCSPIPPNAANTYTATICDPVGGLQLATTTTSREEQFNISGGLPSGPPIVDTNSVDGPVLSGACYPAGSEPPLPSNGPAVWTSADAGTYPSCSAWPCTIDVNTNDPRSVNSLADVAQYYYVTDLRTASNEPRGIDYYRDDVPSVNGGPEDDRVNWQHMTTFSVALGVSGSLKYQADYTTSATGDFADIRRGTKLNGAAANWPLWPNPAPSFYSDPNNYNDPNSIDDFWHAAVNGRGRYFSASDPGALVSGLQGALAGITARLGAGGAAGVSNIEPVPGDNFAYSASYQTKSWTGDVQAHEIDLSTGVLQTPVIWSAQSILDAAVGNACDNRKIMLFRAGATNNLTNFSWNSRACSVAGTPTGPSDTGLNATEQGFFDITQVAKLSQWTNLTTGAGGTPNQRADAAGENFVNFLRGQRGHEGFESGVVDKLYRTRSHTLGDIVNGSPVYVRAPFASYADAGYAAFKSTNSGRAPMLYVPANDGMLHAFYAGTSTTDALRGKEAWAVVPSAMLSKLFRLADDNYKNIHEFFVDGTPSAGDIYDGSAWKTILVGGLNAGGRGFYALDVTDPATPKGLWEFNWSSTCYDSANAATAGADCHIGLSFGRPVITKLSDGRWVVMVTSGYNNVNTTPAAGDGEGYLYVLDAVTGRIIYKISTGAGDATTPSGLAQINNFVDKADINNQTVRVYGGDLLGNVWRFDVNNTTPPAGREATRVATARDASNNPQPITVRPELTQLGTQPMIFVATGKLLGATDVPYRRTQSLYGIVDPVSTTGVTPPFADLRASLAPLTMTQVGVGAGAYRQVTCTGSTASCASAEGWYVDLIDAGERVNVEMKLRARTLVVASNVPDNTVCKPGGYAWLNYFDYKSGLAVTTSPNQSVSTTLAGGLIVGFTVVQLSVPGNPVRVIGTMSDGTNPVVTPAIGPGVGRSKRTSWREVIQ